MLQIPVTIDRSSPVPLYHQLYEQLSAAIETGRLKPGDAFEPARVEADLRRVYGMDEFEHVLFHLEPAAGEGRR